MLRLLPVSTSGGIQGSSARGAVGGNQWTETWTLAFSFSIGQTTSTASFAKIQRYSGSVQVDTSTTPFSLANNETCIVHDIYISGTASQDCLIDVQLSDIPQRKGILASSVNAQQAGRKVMTALQIPLGSPFRFVAYPAATVGTNVTTQTAYADSIVIRA